MGNELIPCGAHGQVIAIHGSDENRPCRTASTMPAIDGHVNETMFAKKRVAQQPVSGQPSNSQPQCPDWDRVTAGRHRKPGCERSDDRGAAALNIAISSNKTASCRGKVLRYFRPARDRSNMACNRSRTLGTRASRGAICSLRQQILLRRQ